MELSPSVTPFTFSIVNTGYSLRFPTALVMWEAQFGDFANVAAHVVDCYLATAEHRWGLKSGLVMLLPHGFEGQVGRRITCPRCLYQS